MSREGKAEYAFDEVCGYFEVGKHNEFNHQKPNSDYVSDWIHAQRKLHELLTGENGAEARVYFCAVDCSRRVGMREIRKMEKWLLDNDLGLFHRGQLVEVGGEFGPKGERFRPAIKITVQNPTQFFSIFKSLSKISNSSCGCSIMVNDGQGVDIRVMPTNYVTGSERRI